MSQGEESIDLEVTDGSYESTELGPNYSIDNS